ncbi:MAG: hypothetical protein K2N80_11650 [Lachnospiraceae bacterium]|nr:hypothetical protein [Lachnospiraceae bacterium]
MQKEKGKGLFTKGAGKKEGGTAFMLDANGITIADIDSTLVGVEDSVALRDSNPKLKKYSAICKKMAAGDLHSDTPVPESNDETATLMYCLAETIQDLRSLFPKLIIIWRNYRKGIS